MEIYRIINAFIYYYGMKNFKGDLFSLLTLEFLKPEKQIYEYISSCFSLLNT
jgi:hypothetical protein